MTVGIKDVAAKAGVSIKTVSRVINGEPHVRPTVRLAVESAIEDLGYRPNPFARSLSNGRSYLIALLIADPGRSYYYAQLQSAALSRCHSQDYHLSVQAVDTRCSQWKDRFRSLASSLCIEGAIVAPPFSRNDDLLGLIEELAIPAVRISAGDHQHKSDSVDIDEEGAASAVTSYLIRMGHRRIGFIAGTETDFATTGRRLGYLAAMRQHDLPVSPDWIVEGDFQFASGVRAAKQFLASPHPVTAIFASNDDMAVGAQAALIASGVPVPDKISVVGFDDAASALLTIPAITTVRQPVAMLAATAVDMLISRITERRAPSSIERRVLPWKLVVRSSATGIRI